MTRTMTVGMLLLGICFLAGCTSPLIRKPRGKDTATPTTSGPRTPAPATPVDKGKATPTQVAVANKGGEIPQAVPPENTTFVDPAQRSEEAALVFQNIYFDYDKYNIRDDAQTRLQEVAKYLLKSPDVKIIIEGHCDERGSREYNLVLGEQRAIAARRFLVSLGVAPGRMFTVSYGKDKPTDPGHDETAWALNRCDTFKISAARK